MDYLFITFYKRISTPNRITFNQSSLNGKKLIILETQMSSSVLRALWVFQNFQKLIGILGFCLPSLSTEIMAPFNKRMAKIYFPLQPLT